MSHNDMIAARSQKRKWKAMQSVRSGYSIPEVAKHMGLSERTIREYVRDVNIRQYKVSGSDKKLQFVIDNALTHTAEQLAKELKVTLSTIRNYERFMRRDPMNPRSVVKQCPGCNQLKPWTERHATKNAVLSLCKDCYHDRYVNKVKVEVLEDLDCVLMSPRIRMKHQIEWKHGSFGSLSPGYSAIQYE